MKADYKNWVPKERLRSMAVNTCVLGGLSILTEKCGNTDNKKMAGCISGIMKGGSVILAAATVWMYMLHRAFDYNGKLDILPTTKVVGFLDGGTLHSWLLITTLI